MTTQTTKTYWMRQGQFANAADFVRCDDPAHVAILEDAGYRRITRDEARKMIRWINGENDAWGSNRAFGAISFAALTNPAHPEYAEYGSHRTVADIEAYA